MFDFCEHDLAGLLSNANVKFTLAEIKKVMQMLLNGLYYIHRNKVWPSKCSFIDRKLGQMHSFIQVKVRIWNELSVYAFSDWNNQNKNIVLYLCLNQDCFLRFFTGTWRQPTCSSPETESWSWQTLAWPEPSAWLKTARGTATLTVWSHCGTDLQNSCWVRGDVRRWDYNQWVQRSSAASEQQ